MLTLSSVSHTVRPSEQLCVTMAPGKAWLEDFLQIRRSDLAKNKADITRLFHNWIELVKNETTPTFPKIKRGSYRAFKDAVWEAIVEDSAQYHHFETDGNHQFYELLCPALGLEIVAVPGQTYSKIRRLPRGDSLVFAAPQRNIPTLQSLAIYALHGDVSAVPCEYKDQLESHFDVWFQFHDRLVKSKCELKDAHRSLLKSATWTALTAPSTVRGYYHIGQKSQCPSIRFNLHCASEWLGLETETDRKKTIVKVRRKLPSGPVFRRTKVKTAKQTKNQKKRQIKKRQSSNRNKRARRCFGCHYMTGDECRCGMIF